MKYDLYDETLKNLYGQSILEFATKESEMLRWLSGPQEPLTRWQRLRLRIGHWWYSVRHSVCCGGHGDDW